MAFSFRRGIPTTPPSLEERAASAGTLAEAARYLIEQAVPDLHEAASEHYAILRTIDDEIEREWAEHDARLDRLIALYEGVEFLAEEYQEQANVLDGETA